MKAMVKTALAGIGLSAPARMLRRRAAEGRSTIYRLLGKVPHKPTEARRYWEARGDRYVEQVQSILAEGSPYYQAQQELLQELAALPWRSLLEVGCGFGWHLRAIQGAHPDRRLVGIDFSWSQLQRGRGHLKGTGVWLSQAEARRLPFPRDTFDLVLTSGLLANIHAGDLPGVLHELKRVARTAVIVLEYAREHMGSPLRQALMDRADWHGHAYTAALTQAGLQVRKAFPFRAFDAYPDRVPLSYFYSEKT